MMYSMSDVCLQGEQPIITDKQHKEKTQSGLLENFTVYVVMSV